MHWREFCKGAAGTASHLPRSRGHKMFDRTESARNGNGAGARVVHAIWHCTLSLSLLVV